MRQLRRVCIIGIGLVGGSLGLALRSLPEPPEVVGVARRDETISQAVALGAVDEGTLDVAQGVSEADLVFIATPVGAIVPMLERIAPSVSVGAIVTDVGSTKTSIVRAAEGILVERCSFIGGHPMAGSERQGVEAASGSLLSGAHYLLTPTPRTDMEAFKKLHSILTQMGAHVLALDPETHDRVMAAISHLPHLASSGLVSVATQTTRESARLLLLAAGGFRDATRIAAGNPSMWADICLDNRQAIIEVIESYRQELSDMAGLIEVGDREALLGKLEEAKKARLSLPSALEIDVGELRNLFIPVVDRPGVISDITLTVGERGVNIEDIEILHASGSSGVLRLTVGGEESARAAAEALVGKGYTVEIKSVAGDT